MHRSYIPIRPILTLAIAGLLSACQPGHIEGTVESVYGEALPGVAVKVQGQPHYSVTNALGTYTLRYTPGNLVLEFIKSGYAPAEMELPVDGFRTVHASAVRMWRLPTNNGVYLYEENKYREATPTAVDTLETEERPLYGTQRDIERKTDNPEPFLVLHRMPPEGVALHRLERQEITLIREGAQATDVDAYVAVEAINVGTAPLDYPARLLHRITLPGSLLPGVYAVNWGALDGHGDYDGRMFMFEVYDPAAGPVPSLTPGDEDAPSTGSAPADESGPSEG